MFAMFSRILKLSGRYKGRIQGAFVCAFLESILSKMPIVLAFVVLSRFAADTLTSQTCLYIGLGLAAAVLVQMLVHVAQRTHSDFFNEYHIRAKNRADFANVAGSKIEIGRASCRERVLELV